MPGAVGITTNWRKSELSAAARERMESSKSLKKYHGALRRQFAVLWTDRGNLPYISKNKDKRSRRHARHTMKYISLMLERIFQDDEDEIDTVVLHRSMPFGHKWQYPFLEDVMTISKMIRAHGVLAISTRDVPSALLSHAHEDSLFDHANKLGELMTHPSSIPGLQVVFSDMNNRTCAPSESMFQLCAALGCDAHRIVSGSPEFKRNFTSHNRSQEETRKALNLVNSLLGLKKGFDKYVDKTSHYMKCF